MSAMPMLLRQVRYEDKAFRRNPAAAFFTVVFPLMFLVIFNTLFGNFEIDVPGGVAKSSTFYVPAIVAFSVIGACYTNIAMGMSFSRDQGLLKRVRGTPLPAAVFLGGRILHSTMVALLLVVIVTATGVLFYDVAVPTNTIPAFLLTLVVGAVSFCALGLATTAIVPNADASPAIVNAIVLPLLFISDVFIPMENAPAWLTTVASIFPIKHFGAALMTAFNPFETGMGFEWLHLGVLAAWGVAGTLLAVRFFSWEPRR
jgi:ABC-2 type transport system permease protein